MYVIMGGTGHVGSATATALLDAGQPVTIISRDPSSASEWVAKGAEVVEADVEDVSSLRSAFQRGRRAFLLNPPADTKEDTDAIERQSVANILAALEGSRLEKVVAESTLGAQRGERIGDLSVLWELEQGLVAQSIPAAVNRAAYYMSNWDAALETVRRTGTLPSMFPADLDMPMVAPADLGRAAAERLMSPLNDIGIRDVEGPRRYSAQDVADTFAEVLGREVHLAVTPYGQWKEAFLALGFSDPAADAYARMTQVTIEGGFAAPENPWRGRTSIGDYLRELTKAEGKQNG